MKIHKLFFTRIFTVAALMILLACSARAQTKAPDSSTDSTYVKMYVDGLACPFCAYGLEKKIKKIEGASGLFIEINEGYITFSVPNKKKPGEATLKKLVKEAGFKAREINFSEKPFKSHE